MNFVRNCGSESRHVLCPNKVPHASIGAQYSVKFSVNELESNIPPCFRSDCTSGGELSAVWIRLVKLVCLGWEAKSYDQAGVVDIFLWKGHEGAQTLGLTPLETHTLTFWRKRLECFTASGSHLSRGGRAPLQRLLLCSHALDIHHHAPNYNRLAPLVWKPSTLC